MPGPVGEHADDLPVPYLAGLGHRQELEAVERVCILPEIRLHHRRRFLLRLARLLEDRGLLAVEATRELLAPPRRLLGLLAHPLQHSYQLLFVVGKALHLLRRALRRLREPEHLGQLALEIRELGHRYDLPAVTLPAASYCFSFSTRTRFPGNSAPFLGVNLSPRGLPARTRGKRGRVLGAPRALEALTQ